MIMLKTTVFPHQNKWGRKKIRETALETVVETVHIIWDCGKNNVASLLSLDVTGAYYIISEKLDT